MIPDSSLQLYTLNKPVINKEFLALVHTNNQRNSKTRMALSRVHTSTKAIDDAKLLLLNKCQVKKNSSQAEYGSAPPNL